ncbi:hypothetical protein, partial [Mesorhizobium sp. M7A.F.Ca.CA.004.02.1.1]
MEMGGAPRDPKHRGRWDRWLRNLSWRSILARAGESESGSLACRFARLFARDVSRKECPKELTKQSPFSSGVVKNREPIVYALIDPDQIESGSIKAIPKERLKKAELSVCRAWEATAVEAWENIMQGQLAKNHQRKDAGYIWASAGEIRKIRLT